ncbi:ammonia-forming cytochrome c nitrite reductase subunit c552 [candidate division KSB1 bacterium]|nr:ammonia-forming cytochrome c nitrite reductase subunit c552 [candidate division KSB1 bacterium]
MIRLWVGYAFSKDHNEERSHYYARLISSTLRGSSWSASRVRALIVMPPKRRS